MHTSGAVTVPLGRHGLPSETSRRASSGTPRSSLPVGDQRFVSVSDDGTLTPRIPGRSCTGPEQLGHSCRSGPEDGLKFHLVCLASSHFVFTGSEWTNGVPAQPIGKSALRFRQVMCGLGSLDVPPSTSFFCPSSTSLYGSNLSL